MLMLAFYKSKAVAEETEELAYRSGKSVDKKRMSFDPPHFRLVSQLLNHPPFL